MDGKKISGEKALMATQGIRTIGVAVAADKAEKAILKR
jgi:hypothetical protein